MDEKIANTNPSMHHNLLISCRLCLRIDGDMKPLFKKDLEHQLVTCTGIKPTLHNQLPSLVCETCTTRLFNSYNFYTECHRSHAYLQNLILDIKPEPMDDTDDRTESNCDIKIEPEVVSDDDKPLIEIANKSSDGTKRPSDDIEVKSKRCKNKQKQCETCGRNFQSSSAMILHIRTHTGEKPFSCTLCDRRFSLKSSLKEHMFRLHTERDQCDVQYTCDSCGKRFNGKNNLTVHIRTHTGEKPHSCSFCPKKFSQTGALVSHERKHRGEKPFSCDKCGRAFRTQSHLARHQSVHSENRPHTCNVCTKTFKSKSNLRDHNRIHTNEKNNVCDQCGSSFLAKAALDVHKRLKHSEKSGKCDVCHKIVSNLESHMVKHTGEKPHECNLCGKRFSHKRGLSLHTHQHTMQFKCDAVGCNRLFTSQNHLECHKMKHVGNFPYVCQYCSKGFLKACSLTTHINLKHLKD